MPLPTFATVFRRWLPWVLLGGVVAMTLAVRWRLRDFPLQRDEGEYAYNAQRILEGEPPYRSAYASQKYPATYFYAAASLAVWPQLPAGLRLSLAVANAGSIILLFLLMRRLFGNFAAVTSAASYALLSVSPGVLGFATHATHFVVLPMLGGLLLLVQAINREKALGRVIGAGALFGLAIMARQPAIAFAAFGGATLITVDWRAKRPVLVRASFFCLGVAAPLMALFGYLWITGVFPRFWFWTFTYAAEYGSQATMREGWEALRKVMPGVMARNELIWLAAGCGLGKLVRVRDGRLMFFAGWLGASAAAVAAGLYFREHYFIQLLPAVAALAGVNVAGLSWKTTRLALGQKAAAASVFLILAACLWLQRDYLFRTPVVELCRSIYRGNLFPESEVVAHELRARSHPGDKVAIMGSEPQIYALAGLRAATGYLYTYALMEESPFAERFQQEMSSEIEATRPRFIVVVNQPISWLIRPHSPTMILNWTADYLAGGYRLIGIAEDGSQALWDNAVPENLPEASHLAIFERREK